MEKLSSIDTLLKQAAAKWVKMLHTMSPAERTRMPWRPLEQYTKGIREGNENIREILNVPMYDDMRKMPDNIEDMFGQDIRAKGSSALSAGGATIPPGGKWDKMTSTWKEGDPLVSTPPMVYVGRNSAKKMFPWANPKQQDLITEFIKRHELNESQELLKGRIMMARNWSHASPAVIGKEMNLLRNLPDSVGKRIADDMNRRPQYDYVSRLAGLGGNYNYPRYIPASSTGRLSDVFGELQRDRRFSAKVAEVQDAMGWYGPASKGLSSADMGEGAAWPGWDDTVKKVYNRYAGRDYIRNKYDFLKDLGDEWYSRNEVQKMLSKALNATLRETTGGFTR